MFSSKPMLFLLLAVFFALLSHGTSQITHHQTQQSSGVISGMFHVGRVILQTTSGDVNSSLILADKRTLRKDPIDDFKYYMGGWNISNEHYISSVAYTAAPFFAIAAIWFAVFGVSLLLICCCYCCCRRSPYGYSKIAYALSLIFLSLFTIAAIIGSVVLYTGQGKFHESTTDTLDYVVSQSNDTVYNLNNVSSILSVAKGIQVDQVSLPSNITTGIDRVDKMISDASRSLEFETRKNQKDIKRVLDDIRLALIIIAAVMLLAALLGFLFSILGLQFLVYILVILGWILVTATLILCGIFLALHNIMGDTCVAMDEWVEYPMAHTALDDILPCVDNATAQETLSQSKDVTFQLITMVNNIINNVANINPPPLPISFPGFLRYNQSGPLVPTLCNPLYANRTDRICQTGELDFNNATTVWLNYVCQVNANNTCTTVGRLTPKMYQQMSAAVNVSDGLTEYSPFLAGLLDCSFVRETFIGIHRDHCPDLNKFSGWVYIGLALSSAAVMFSLVLWVLYARERKHRKYTKLVLESTSSPGAAHRQWK
ncbi:glutamyl-tRNA(Gln) amidotransferase subunit D like protein [Tanacetum coccineum]